MNPTTLRVSNFRGIASLEWDIAEGATALIGPNGSGKSSRLLAIEYALFGPKGRSATPYLMRRETEMQVELQFEHGEQTYRVRRGYSARGAGKTWLTLDVADTLMPPWVPLTRETASETQALIEELLGLSRATFTASAYSPQDAGGAWTESDPATRKAILAEILALSGWDDLLGEAKKRRQSVERDLTKARAESDGEAVVRVLEAESRLADAERLNDALGEQEAGLAEAFPELQRVAQEMHTAAAQAGVIVQAAKDARARRDQAVEQRDTLIGRIDEAHDKLSGIDEAQEAAAEVPALEENLANTVKRNEIARQRNADQRAEYQARVDVEARAQLAYNTSVATCGEAERALEGARHRRETASGPEPECPTCHQALVGDAHLATFAALNDECERLSGVCIEHARASEKALTTLEQAIAHRGTEPGDPTVWPTDQIERNLRLARIAAERVAAAEGWRAQLAAMETELAQVTQAVSRLEVAFAETDAAAMAVHDVDARLRAAEGALKEATTRDAEIRRKRRDAASDVATRTAELANARTRAETAEAAAARAGELEQSLNDLLLLERGYGRDGVPSLIVETVALPAIQTEANRILDDLASPFRVDLRSQKTTKSGEVREALDIVIHTPTGEALFETLSGGEATRVNVALRIGLARLLASRRGADVGLFAIDEPDGLDQDGADRLAVILRELARSTFRSVILVSHQNGLRDALDQVIELTGEDAPTMEAVAA